MSRSRADNKGSGLSVALAAPVNGQRSACPWWLYAAAPSQCPSSGEAQAAESRRGAERATTELVSAGLWGLLRLGFPLARLRTGNLLQALSIVASSGAPALLGLVVVRVWTCTLFWGAGEHHDAEAKGEQ